MLSLRTTTGGSCSPQSAEPGRSRQEPVSRSTLGYFPRMNAGAQWRALAGDPSSPSDPALRQTVRMTRIPTVRVATVADVSVVADLLDRFNREYEAPTPGPAVLGARLERLLTGGSVVALLAGEPAVGLALMTLRPNVWYEGTVALLDELYVVGDERGHGIGTALLKAAEQECRRLGGELLEINVDGEDTDARRFYERHGYTNREPGHTEPALYYHRDLAP